MRMNWRPLRSYALFLSVVLLAFGSWRAEAKPSRSRPAEAIPGEYVVKFQSETQMMSAKMNKSGRIGVLSMNPLKTDGRFATVRVERNVSRQRALSMLRTLDGVVYAEPNYIYRASKTTTVTTAPKYDWDDDWGNPGWGNDPGWGFPGWGDIGNPGGGRNGGGTARTPNDPRFAELWGMLNMGQADPKGQTGVAGVDIGGPAAWGITTGSREIKVAIIDTGVDYNHEDLAANIFTNAGEVANNGIDDDNNGFVDDIHGWNFVANTNDPMDDNKHGTHCAGTIGGLGDNNIGVAGVSWQVSIIPIKFLSGQGSGSLADAVDSIKYATKMGVHIMSNSWGGGGFSQALADAITEAKQAGILFVAAAGNESNNNDARPTYPAGYTMDNVLSVAAIDNKDMTASWSNYGQRTVHLGAPGVNIMSSTPGNRYESLSGTSMACPHVAGAAALLWSANRQMNYAEIKQRLTSTVEPTRILMRKTISGGRLNIYNALMNRIPGRVAAPEDHEWVVGSFTAETPHNYTDNMAENYQVYVPGAKYIRVHFSRISTEDGYDFVKILDGQGDSVEDLTGDIADYTSMYIDGEVMNIQMISDAAMNAWGFQIDRVEYVR